MLALAGFVTCAKPRPEVVIFEARPERIAVGGSSQLVWQVRGAVEVEISGLGEVPRAGSGIVSPVETTTYTLTARSRHDTRARGEVAVRVERAPE